MNSVTSGKSILYSLPSREDEKLSSGPPLTVNENVINRISFLLFCRLMAICEDIYAARAEGELGVEEVLYWTLVKIYRSPHMLLEYTKID